MRQQSTSVHPNRRTTLDRPHEDVHNRKQDKWRLNLSSKVSDFLLLCRRFSAVLSCFVAKSYLGGLGSETLRLRYSVVRAGG